jgi:hypothetical protein
MNRVLSVFLSLMLLCTAAWPDGFPFDPETQRVTRPSLRLKLTPEQTREISATGTLTFSEEHLRLIRLHYPAATNRADVITATFNDNVEGLTPEDVYCFWVAPDEVAITLNEARPKEKPPFEPPSNDRFPDEAELKERPDRHIRLGLDGSIYYRGQSITLAQAFALIDDLARVPTPDRDKGRPDRYLYVVLPPPLAGREVYSVEEHNRPSPPRILDALTVYGESRSVQVGREW